MREIFHAELAQLGHDLTEMSGLVETAITRAGKALLTADLDLAQDVISADNLIDARQQELDDRCVLMLAQQQPVATDLRVIVSALRMSASLERMGDLARHIAQVARGRFPHVAIEGPLLETFRQMDESATHVADRVTRLLDTRDLDLAGRIEDDDDLLDRLHTHSFSRMLAPDWEGDAQQTIDVTLLARYYERFGDHGVSVASRVRFLVTGTE